MADLAIFEFIRTLGKGKFGKVVEVERKKTRSTKSAFFGLLDTLIHQNNWFELHGAVRGTRSLERVGMTQSKGARFALKTIKAGADDELVLNEHDTLFALQSASPYVLRICEAFLDSEIEEQSFLLEACQGGDLLQMVMKRHPKVATTVRCEATLRQICRQIGSALFAAHRCRIIHRDVKLENIFFRDIGCREAVLGDWGLSVELSEELEDRTDHCGSPHYAAPEIANHLPYSFAVDMWALGIVMYAVITGRFPFFGASTEEIHLAIRRAKSPERYQLPPDLACQYSQQALDCMRGLLEPDVEKRMTSAELLTLPWLVME